jgi:hypothetical protein
MEATTLPLDLVFFFVARSLKPGGFRLIVPANKLSAPLTRLYAENVQSFPV